MTRVPSTFCVAPVVAVLTLSGCTKTAAEPVQLNTGDTVMVTEVKKGDELVVEKDGEKAGVRMVGIHSYQDVIKDPELTALGDASKGFLRETLEGQLVTITLEGPKKDSHGRYLGYVALKDGTDVNKAMIENGVAIVYTEYGFSREANYLAAEVEARAENKLIWSGKGTKTATGLRKQWAEVRSGRGHMLVSDPLIAPIE